MSTAHQDAEPRPTVATTRSPVGAATALLDALGDGDRFLATPTRTLLARGVRTEIPHGRAPLAERVAHALHRAGEGTSTPALVVGAVPFDQSAPAALVIPETVRTAPALATDPLTALPPAAPPPLPGLTVRPEPEPEVYAKSVATATDRMWQGELSKVVLARTLELTAPTDLDIPAMVRGLAHRDPAGYTYALPTTPDLTLLGASPELLLSRRGRHLVSNPLAGSAPRADDLAEDVRRAAALLRSAKDLHEHAVVVDAVHRALAPYCATIDVPGHPSLTRTATMWHLSTTITATLAHPATSALEIAAALHPTPAVCGTPTPVARRMIGELEPFDRGFFTGMVGWGNAEGDGEWAIALRCAEVGRRALRLYAGAGIVSASDPEAETAETTAKFRTFLNTLGVER
ncbi:isochorismate synthase [Streptomyces sp. NBRC 109706]|uniref:isochorismate synthase n=1 Tax=Streptomyces sp. NBRC 109706 TaxID=1550035 RepID=UPI000780E0F2|nr:isochorismate synthase [Streptomyces sp. NBRC 109706]